MAMRRRRRAGGHKRTRRARRRYYLSVRHGNIPNRNTGITVTDIGSSTIGVNNTEQFTVAVINLVRARALT